MKQTAKKMMALFLSLIMLISVVPANVFAATYDDNDDYYNVVSQKNWELAPGITESEIVLNNDSGDRRQVMHVVEVDMNNEYTKVIPSYKGMVPKAGSYGVQTMDQQAAFAEANGYGNVVAAMNLSLSWYDSDYYTKNPQYVGEPLGYMILNGEQYTNSAGQKGGAQTCLVINFDEKDGEARPSDMPKVQIRSTSDTVTGWEEQVIPANFGFVVKDGKLVTTKEEHASEGAPRSMVGIKADGTIVTVMNDGRQSPYSIGFNSYEMGEAMLNLGCVYAINGDGGGSSQFLSQRPGEELEFHCSPSDGSPRPTTHGILIITTAPSDGTFVRAHVESDYAYYTPGCQVQFNATGADLAGAAADIPAEAYWQLSDDTMGTIDENGLFVSNGKTGAVKAQLMYNEKTCGEAEINVVHPDSIEFNKAAYSVPYESSISFDVTAKYGIYEVAMRDGDYDITVADSNAGTFGSDFKFVSGNEAVSTTVTVTYTGDTSVTSTVPLQIGKGSEVIFDFEEGTASSEVDNWTLKVHAGDPIKDPKDTTNFKIVNSETGMVHNGEQALAINIPFHKYVHGADDAYDARSIQWIGDNITLENATSIGFWIYIPEEATQSMIYVAGVWYDAKDAVQRGDKEVITIDQFDGMEYSGWHYVSVPIDKELFYIGDSAIAKKRNFFLKFYSTCEQALSGDETSYYPDVTYYVDDVTVDYSSVVSDRENPVFGDSYAYNQSTEGQTALAKGETVVLGNASYNFGAKVSDAVKDNATGINSKAVKSYVDGVEVQASYRNGEVVTDAMRLNEGTHRIIFEAADNEGNIAKIVRYVKIDENKTPEIQVIPKSDAESILTGSVYWIDVKANEAENVSKITMKLDLDTMHEWELDYSEIANGCTIKYYFETEAEKAEDIVTVEIIHNGSLSGETVLASLPIRVWYSEGNTEDDVNGMSAGQSPADAWNAKDIAYTSVNVEVEKGVVTYKDENTSTFSADKISVDTEAFSYGNDLAGQHREYWLNNTYHVHSEEAMDDKQATCTESGYTERTFCKECDSVVDWGTKEEAKGHSFTVTNDDMYECEICDALFYYVNGESQKGWITVEENIYYFNQDGEAVDGEATVDGHTYTFTDHVLTEAAWEHDGTGLTCWWAGEQVEGGWKTICGNKYYFTGFYATTGFAKVGLGTNVGQRYHLFDENGVFQQDFTGIIEHKDELHFAKNGACTVKGLVEDLDGNIYYVNSAYLVITNTAYMVSEEKTNGILPEGVYTFGKDGKLIPVKNGLVQDEDGEIRYYVNGEAMYAGVVQDTEGNYYYINSTKKAVKNTAYYIYNPKTNGLIDEGKYVFGSDGKMVIEDNTEPEQPEEPNVKNGLVQDEDGEIRYYVNGEATYAGVVQDAEGNYYYINSTKKAVRNTAYCIYNPKTNGLIDEGKYVFGKEGKMIL